MITSAVATPDFRSPALGMTAEADLVVMPRAARRSKLERTPAFARQASPTGMDRVFSNLEAVTILMPGLMAF